MAVCKVATHTHTCTAMHQEKQEMEATGGVENSDCHLKVINIYHCLQDKCGEIEEEI